MAGETARFALPLNAVDGFGRRSVAGKTILISQRFMHAAHLGLLAVADIAGSRSRGRKEESKKER